MPFTLLHPGLFAFGLACVSIPIILHLLKRKRRPIPWGAMRFLEQAYRKRRRILTIEQLILLALRCLLLALIAMGVGSLMLGSGLQQALPTTMVIVIDQSIGSALVDGETTSLEMNKAFALRAIDELYALRGDRVVLIGAAKPAGGLVMPESSDLSSVRTMIERLEPTDSKLDLAQALLLAGGLNRNPDSPSRQVLVIASSMRGIDPWASDAADGGRFDRVLALSPATQLIDNIGIESVSLTRSLVSRSGVTLPMGVRVAMGRSGNTQAMNQSSTIRVRNGAGEQIGQRTIQWKNNQRELEAVVAIDSSSIKPTGARTALISVQLDDDANMRDHIVRLPVPIRSTISVGVVAIAQDSLHSTAQSSAHLGSTISPSRWVRSALAPNDSFGISIVDIDARRASSMLSPSLDALIILAPSVLEASAWERIAQLNASGMLVVVTPDSSPTSLDWIDRVQFIDAGLISGGSTAREHEQAIGLGINQSFDKSSLLMGIAQEFDRLGSAVSANKSIRFVAGENSKPLAFFDDGSVFAVQTSLNNSTHELGQQGMVVVFSVAFDLEWTNLPARPLFVAMLQEIVRQGVGVGSSMPVITAGTSEPQQPWVVTSHRLVLYDGSPDNGSNSLSQSATQRSGVIAQLDSQGTTRAYVVINPDVSGAKTDPAPIEQIEESLMSSLDVETIDWIEPAGLLENANTPQSERTKMSMLDSTRPGVSIALWMLMAAGVIAAIELVLARLFTARLFDSNTLGVKGAHT